MNGSGTEIRLSRAHSELRVTRNIDLTRNIPLHALDPLKGHESPS